MKLAPRYLLAVAVLVPSYLAAWDSPMFRADAAHSGLYDAAGVPKFTKIKWQFHTEGRVYSSPAVVKGTVYFGSTDHHLYGRSANRHAEVEGQDRQPGDLVACGGERHRVLRQLRRTFLCQRR